MADEEPPAKRLRRPAVASAGTNDDVCDASTVSATLTNKFDSPLTTSRHDPFHWWYLKSAAKKVVEALARENRFVERLEHRQVNNVYSNKPMVYLLPVGQGESYRFQPRTQYAVEALLVEYWDSILGVFVDVKRGAAVDFAADFRAAVLDPFAKLLALVDGAKRCTTPAEFVAAVEWLIQEKELTLLRVHVCGAPDVTESGPVRWSRDGPVPFQLASALPDAARGWWYSETALLEEFMRRGAGDAAAEDIAVLFLSNASAARVSKRMRLGSARNTRFLWISSSTKVTPHSVSRQLDGSVNRPSDYVLNEPFPRVALAVWRDWKANSSPATPTRPASELSAPATAPLPPRTEHDDAAGILNEIAVLNVAPWRLFAAAATIVEFTVASVVKGPSHIERSARFDVDCDSVYFTVYLGGRKVPYDDSHVADFKEILTVDQAREALLAASALKVCSGFSKSDIHAKTDQDGDTLQEGFVVAVSLALRYSANCERRGRSLRHPTIGALPARKKSDVVTIAEDGDEGQGGVDFDFDPPPEVAAVLQPGVGAGVRHVAETELSMLLERRGDGECVFRSARCAITGGESGGRCARCSDCRSNFRNKMRRLVATRRQGTPHKNAPSSYVAESPGLTKKRLEHQANAIVGLRRKLRDLAANERNANGFVVEDGEHHRQLAGLFAIADEAAKNAFPDDSVARAVWEDQLENCRRAAEHGGKRYASSYSPATIKVAIALSAKLGKAGYDEVRRLFCLPTCRHLQSFSRFAADDEEGVMVDMIEEMMKKVDAADFDYEWKRCGCLTFDSMSIKGGVFFEHHTGRILGFPYDDGAYSAVMSEFQARAQSLQDNDEALEPEPARHYLVFYFVGLGTSGFAFPVARFALTTILSATLTRIFNSIVVELAENCFIVVAAVFDGAQENRTFQKMHATRAASEFLEGFNVSWDAGFLIAMNHPVYGSDFPIFLFSDTPHGVKKVTNALESSNEDNVKTRQLQCLASDGRLRPLSLNMCRDAWIDYEGLKVDSVVCGEAPLKRTELTRHHFEKNAFSRMRVPLAAQVLSNTMCSMIDEAYGNDPHRKVLYEPLRRLCFEMNRFFDIMNGQKDYHNIRNVDAKELHDLDEMMKWFEAWYNSIHEDPAFSAFTAEEKEAAFLPEECWYDLQSIVKGVTALSAFYLRKFKDSPITIVQHRLMQDIVEHHFAHVRQSCGASNQPTQKQAHLATSTAGSLRVARSTKDNAGAAPVNHDPHAPIPRTS